MTYYMSIYPQAMHCNVMYELRVVLYTLFLKKNVVVCIIFGSSVAVKWNFAIYFRSSSILVQFQFYYFEPKQREREKKTLVAPDFRIHIRQFILVQQKNKPETIKKKLNQIGKEEAIFKFSILCLYFNAQLMRQHNNYLYNGCWELSKLKNKLNVVTHTQYKSSNEVEYIKYIVTFKVFESSVLSISI